MRLFEDFKMKFENPDWSRSPELGLIDSILEQHPHLIGLLSEDFTVGKKPGVFGRKDTPSMEQIVRAAIYKELKGLEYRELEFHQTDSRICAAFIKIDELRPYSFQVYQKYISRIKADNLQKLLVELNKIAINAGIEDIERIRQDSTVVETNIHHPTNNSILWDCIKEAYRLLGHLSEEVDGLKYRDYTKQGKKTYFKINNTKGDNRKDLFSNQLTLFIKTINQVSNVIKKKQSFGIKAMIWADLLGEHIEVMQLVYDMAYLKEIKGEKAPNEEKIYSIYERHTDIIVKGARDIKFGHKVDFSSGKSNLVLNCRVLKGNPSDSKLFAPAIDAIIGDYGKVPRDYATDGGYASLANQSHAKGKGIVNIVFNKIVGSLGNIATSKNMETRLKKWRSGMEAVISNIKRGFNLARCTWKGFKHFEAKVLWSVIAYNIRVMTGHIVKLV
ncbi:MAG: ISNCY family transposase [Prolixibacteraceae bacterium]|jgi:IS5 family transposase|nr:ISNCY family transposase [Prolixibacteraceae bacterium]